MSQMKNSQKFISKAEGILPRAYVVHKSFHPEYDIFYRWLDTLTLQKEFRDPAVHCIQFTEDDESTFLHIFGVNVL